MSSRSVPHRGLRILSLALLCAWSTIGGGVGLNALIKSDQQQSALKNSAPPPTVITIDTHDIFTAGLVSTIFCTLFGVLFFPILCSLVFLRSPLGVAQKSLKLQSLVLAFCTIALGACMIPYSLIFATRSAQITAMIGQVSLPQSVIDQAAKQLGQTAVYKDIYYLQLVNYLQWMTFLFALIATIISFRALSASKLHPSSSSSPRTAFPNNNARSSGATEHSSDDSVGMKDMDGAEKAQIEHRV